MGMGVGGGSFRGLEKAGELLGSIPGWWGECRARFAVRYPKALLGTGCRQGGAAVRIHQIRCAHHQGSESARVSADTYIQKTKKVYLDTRTSRNIDKLKVCEGFSCEIGCDHLVQL